MFNENRLIFFSLDAKRPAVPEKKKGKEAGKEKLKFKEAAMDKKMDEILKSVKPATVKEFSKKMGKQKGSSHLNKRFCVDVLNMTEKTIRKYSSAKTKEIVRSVQRRVNSVVPKVKLKEDGYVGQKTLKGLEKRQQIPIAKPTTKPKAVATKPAPKFKKRNIGEDEKKAASGHKAETATPKAKQSVKGKPAVAQAYDAEVPGGLKVAPKVLKRRVELKKHAREKERAKEGMDLNADVYDPLQDLLKQIKSGNVEETGANKLITKAISGIKKYASIMKKSGASFIVKLPNSNLKIQIQFMKGIGAQISLIQGKKSLPLSLDGKTINMKTASMLKPKEKFDANQEIHDPLVRIASLVESGKSENYVTDLKRALKGMKKLGLKKWDVDSPSKKFKLTLAVNKDGRPSLTTKIDGKVVQVTKSKLSSLSAQVRNIKAPKDIAV